jgi:hypothetical protein
MADSVPVSVLPPDSGGVSYGLSPQGTMFLVGAVVGIAIAFVAIYVVKNKL